MSLTSEEERALEWQRAVRRREAFQRSLQGLLKGSGSAYKEVFRAWLPLKRS